MPDGAELVQLRLPNFQGPLPELVRLAVDRRVDVESVLVAAVTDQVARFVTEPERVDLGCAGDAVAWVSRLLALKSTRLLDGPAVAEETEPRRTERPEPADLPLLRARAAGLRAREGLESLSPPVMSTVVPRRVQPHPPEVLLRAWHGMRSHARPVTHGVALPRFLRLETVISGLLRRVRSTSRLSFRHLTREAGRIDIVTHFLAILELCRRGQVVATQRETFGDITIEQSARDADADRRAG